MITRSLAPIAVLVAAACTGTDTGNPYQQPLSVDAHSSDPASYAVATASGGGVVAEAWLSLEPASFVADGQPECDGGAVTGGEGAFELGVADHAAAGGTELEITLTAGDYCALVVPLVRAEAPLPGGAPVELEGAAMVLIGTTAAGTDFVLVKDSAATLTVSGADAFALEPELGALFVGFDVATWLGGVDIDAAGGGGTAIIDADTNAGLLADFEANLAAGVELFRDADSDGVPDPGDPPIATGQ